MNRIAFYAPLKPPDHPIPSGDRAIARLLMSALAEAGMAVELASGFRSYDAAGDPARQQRLRQLGERQAARLIARYRRRPPAQRPDLWLTYHLYHKAPDWIGPAVSRALGIPYVIAEASYAHKQRQGPWRLGLEASRDCFEQAALALCLNPTDKPGLGAIAPQLALADLLPFIATGPLLAEPRVDKAALAQSYGLDPTRPWLISVAMMRPGAKLRSYQLLADAMAQLSAASWELLLVGDGEARAAVAQAFAPVPHCHLLGALDHARLIPLLHASELLLWPAIDEAFGMALLEAQACATAVVAGQEGGVASIVAEGISGRLVPARDATAFASTVAALLRDPTTLRQMQQAARRRIAQYHSLEGAAQRLQQLLRPLLPRRDD